ncbi:unnamed protein product [Echinostoma caproni]|uniref:General transcription factor IIH subunit 4 n=1 Tax=Echinostoma caproni TaxID=27848 RepID=A0A183AWD0_9TREM|nr:unnamed protein product [Echinostoma caproni]
MRELGLAYQSKRTSPRFYVTQLALGLASGHTGRSDPSAPVPGCTSGAIPTGVTAPDQSDGASMLSRLSATSSSDVGYILLETNFRLYAYTDSHLRTALLSLFSKIRARFPNLVVADITRDSVREALIRGITADQIISYLVNNAHPDMLRGPQILPPTLVDQIRLWELERDRFVFQEGCLYEQFSKSTDFEMVRDYAKISELKSTLPKLLFLSKDLFYLNFCLRPNRLVVLSFLKSIGALLWENPERRLMVVSRNGHEDVRKFWKQKRPS